MKSYCVKFSVLIFSLFVISCSVEENRTTLSLDNVYISGQKNNHACYWKGGLIHLLDDGSFSSSSADTLIVMNNDVHILGSGYNGFYETLYWKNNMLTNLTTNYSTSTDAVEYIGGMDINTSNDLYIVGITKNLVSTPTTYDLVYWKNHVKYNVTSFTNLPNHEVRIKVINDDVYISCPKEISGVMTEGYFVNGSFTSVPNVYITGITMLNSDLYIYGRTDAYLSYYKNCSTNIDTSTSGNGNHIFKMSYDNGIIYAVNDGNIIENGIITYTIPASLSAYNYYRVTCFEVKNNTKYMITTEDITSTNYVDQMLYIDNSVVLQNNPDEVFKCLFIEN